MKTYPYRTSLIKILTMLSLLAIGLIVVISCSSESETAKTEQVETEGQLYTCGMHPEVILHEPGQCPKCGMDLVPLKSNTGGSGAGQASSTDKGKILYWQAPMNPTEIYDKPGKSKMGMDLVPVYEGQVSSGSSIQIDPVTVQNMGVRTTAVQRLDFQRTLRTVGKIDFNEENIYVVSSKISGWIEKLNVDYTGQEVRKGQTLLEVYSPELVTTQQEYLLALKNRDMVGQSGIASVRESAESLVNASRQRLTYWDIPNADIRRLEESGQVRKTLRLVSPADGVVIHKNALTGMHIKEGANLYRIADLSTVWLNASIYDNEASWIREGLDAELELAYAPGKTLHGRVAYIYPYLSEKARDIKVRFEFPNSNLRLKPGMYGNVRIKTPPIHDALVVPTEAVIRSGQRNLVFIARGDGRFEPREVTIGEESEDGHIRIVSGLIGNEDVVISAQFMLDSESRLQEAIQKMLAEKSGASAKNEAPAADHSDHNMQDMEDHDGHNMDAMEEHSGHDMDDHSAGEMDHSKMQSQSAREEMDMSSDNESKEMQMDMPAKSKFDSSAGNEMKCATGKCGGK